MRTAAPTVGYDINWLQAEGLLDASGNLTAGSKLPDIQVDVTPNAKMQIADTGTLLNDQIIYLHYQDGHRNDPAKYKVNPNDINRDMPTVGYLSWASSGGVGHNAAENRIPVGRSFQFYLNTPKSILKNTLLTGTLRIHFNNPDAGGTP